MIKIRGDVDELRRLCLNRRHHLRVAMAGGTGRDARRPIDIAVTVDVPYLGTAAVVHHKGVVARIGRGNGGGIAGQHRLRHRTWYVELVDSHRTVRPPSITVGISRWAGWIPRTARSQQSHPCSVIPLNL